MMVSARPYTDAKAPDEVERLRQRAVTERLLIGALRAQDIARQAVAAEGRASYLASAGRQLAGVLDQQSIRDIVRRCALPRVGAWSIVDIIEASGVPFRLAAVHPDPVKAILARSLEDHWDAAMPNEPQRAAPAPQASREPKVINRDSEDALVAIAHSAANLATLRKIGFNELLVVPLSVHDTVLGAITFVTREGDACLSADDIALAVALADQCAFALENARLYAEADQLRTNAEAANRAKSIFLGNMTHELLTPLNAIGGYADLIEMGLRGPVTADQRTDLERIKASQQHLIALIKGILEYVHSETGQINYRSVSVAVPALLREVADMLHGAATEKHLELQTPTGNENDAVLADPLRARQIVANLVANAVKYSSVGSGPIKLSYAVQPDTVRITVSDAGPGIPVEKLDAVFEAFVQLASGISDRQGGVGLGLAISLDLARAMGGDLTLESTVGIGSRFILTLPRALAE